MSGIDLAAVKARTAQLEQEAAEEPARRAAELKQLQDDRWDRLQPLAHSLCQQAAALRAYSATEEGQAVIALFEACPPLGNMSKKVYPVDFFIKPIVSVCRRIHTRRGHGSHRERLYVYLSIGQNGDKPALVLRGYRYDDNTGHGGSGKGHVKLEELGSEQGPTILRNRVDRELTKGANIPQLTMPMIQHLGEIQLDLVQLVKDTAQYVMEHGEFPTPPETWHWW